jgi:hypothetical protein
LGENRTNTMRFPHARQTKADWKLEDVNRRHRTSRNVLQDGSPSTAAWKGDGASKRSARTVERCRPDRMAVSFEDPTILEMYLQASTLRRLLLTSGYLRVSTQSTTFVANAK